MPNPLKEKGKKWYKVELYTDDPESITGNGLINDRKVYESTPKPNTTSVNMRVKLYKIVKDYCWECSKGSHSKAFHKQKVNTLEAFIKQKIQEARETERIKIGQLKREWYMKGQKEAEQAMRQGLGGEGDCQNHFHHEIIKNLKSTLTEEGT